MNQKRASGPVHGKWSVDARWGCTRKQKWNGWVTGKGRARSNRCEWGAETAGEFVGAGRMAVGEDAEEVKFEELADGMARRPARERGIVDVAKGRVMLSLGPMGVGMHGGEVCGWQEGHARCQRHIGRKDWKRIREKREREQEAGHGEQTSGSGKGCSEQGGQRHQRSWRWREEKRGCGSAACHEWQIQRRTWLQLGWWWCGLWT